MSARTVAFALTVAGGLLAVHGCAIDFDAPFAQSGTAGSPLPEGGTDASGGTGGTAGAAGSAGMGGTGGSDTGGTGGDTGGSGGTNTGGTSGTGGSGGTSTGGTGGAITGGTGGMGPSETCNNSEDDDNDGLTDCADPDCSAMGYACLPSPPSLWSGPVQFNLGELPDCAGPWSDSGSTGGSDLLDVPTQCQSCSCDPPTDAKCGMDVEVFADLGCAGASQSSAFYSDGLCINVGMQALGPESVRPTSGIRLFSGSCTAKADGNANFPPPAWKDPAWTCFPSSIGAGCDAPLTCVPPADGGAICVTRPGIHDDACPVDYGDLAWVLYRGVDDTRTCSGCTCGAPTGDCSGAEIRVEDPSGGCVGTGTLLTSGVCTTLPIHSSMGTFALESGLPGGLQPTCTPSGGNPDGSLEPTSPLTVCCRAP